jgi:hypothetical protein
MVLEVEDICHNLIDFQLAAFKIQQRTSNIVALRKGAFDRKSPSENVIGTPIDIRMLSIDTIDDYLSAKTCLLQSFLAKLWNTSRSNHTLKAIGIRCEQVLSVATRVIEVHRNDLVGCQALDEIELTSWRSRNRKV